MQEQPTPAIYTCQREGCSNNAGYKLVHRRYDELFQYICNEHMNDDLGRLMIEEYLPISVTEG